MCVLSDLVKGRITLLFGLASRSKKQSFWIRRKVVISWPTLAKEFIISQKLFWIRKGKYCTHVVYTKILHISKDFLFSQEKFTSYNVLFYERFDHDIGTFPLNLKQLHFKNWWIWFVGKYVIPNFERKSSKLALSLQYLQKEMSDDVDFLHAFCPGIPEVPKWLVWNYFKAATRLLGRMGVKKIQALYHKAFL